MTNAKHTPGPWRVGYRALDVGCKNAKIGGYAKLFDVRGWGYLTGGGHGALGLSEDEAVDIQQANARLIAAAPELLEALKELKEWIEDECGAELPRDKADAAIAKAEGRERKERGMSDYDMSIHTNPDATAWAKFYVETRERFEAEGRAGRFDDEENMVGWFSNAMMAMHDHLTGQHPVVLPDGSAFFKAEV